MIDVNLPKIGTKLDYDVPFSQKQIDKSVIGIVLDLRKTLWKKIKVSKKLSATKVLCRTLWKRNKEEYVIEIENLSGYNTIGTALNKWLLGKDASLEKEFEGKDLRFKEKVYLKNPRLYEIRFNRELFLLDIRFPHLKEMGKDFLFIKRKLIKRSAKIETTLVESWLLEKLKKFRYEKTIERNKDIAKNMLDLIVDIAVQVENHPPKPIQPPFYFRKNEIKKIGAHLLKLCKQNSKSDSENLLNLDSIFSSLADDFDEIITKKKIKDITKKMERKIRKIARVFYSSRIENSFTFI